LEVLSLLQRWPLEVNVPESSPTVLGLRSLWRIIMSADSPRWEYCGIELQEQHWIKSQYQWREIKKNEGVTFGESH